MKHHLSFVLCMYDTSKENGQAPCHRYQIVVSIGVFFIGQCRSLLADIPSCFWWSTSAWNRMTRIFLTSPKWSIHWMVGDCTPCTLSCVLIRSLASFNYRGAWLFGFVHSMFIVHCVCVCIRNLLVSCQWWTMSVPPCTHSQRVLTPSCWR